jgi:type I restriction enzyme R subunit
VRLNKSRVDYLERYQRLIDEYNAGAISVDLFFARLVAFAKDLNAEEQRHVREHLSEEELAVFDLIQQPDLSGEESQAVKLVARDLLATLKRERKLSLDWRRYQRSRAEVRVVIGDMLDRLPASYAPQMYRQACDSVYQHIYDSYYGAGRSIYDRAA